MTLQALNIDTLVSFNTSFNFRDVMNQNFIAGNIQDTLNSDTATAALSVTDIPAHQHFLQQKELIVNIVTRHQNYTDWISVYFWGILLLVTLIWYFFPERVLRILSREGSRHKLKYSDNQFAKPGLMLYALYILTFISSISVFILLIFTAWFPNIIDKLSFNKLLWGIPLLIGLYFLLRMVVIYLTGFIFKTSDIASKQIRENFRANMIQSFLLIPVLIILLSTSYNYIIYAGILIMALVITYKWALLLIIGLKSSKISLYHNILYLCALEIIPVIVIIKLLEFTG